MVCGVVVGCSLVVLYNSLVKLYKTAHSCVLKWLLGVGGGAAPLNTKNIVGIMRMLFVAYGGMLWIASKRASCSL